MREAQHRQSGQARTRRGRVLAAQLAGRLSGQTLRHQRRVAELRAEHQRVDCSKHAGQCCACTHDLDSHAEHLVEQLRAAGLVGLVAK